MNQNNKSYQNNQKSQNDQVSGVWKNSAPSNIALIKYMGKIEGQKNQATNKSLSYALEHLRTFVEITLDNKLQEDQWQPLIGHGLYSLELSEKGRKRFLDHFLFLKDKWGIKNNYLIKSANNFPSDCGLASSASSFAALTKTAADCFGVLVSELELAKLSRLGSGSSCRSLFGPWVSWHQDEIQNIELNHFQKLYHIAVIVEAHKKEVSSSEAHTRVVTSSLFEGRIMRAEKRLHDLLAALQSKDWKKSYELCWSEFWDMHALFETSTPHFGYMTEGSLKALRLTEKIWSEYQDGPIVTMDAGANVHLLLRDDQIDLARKICQKFAQESGNEFKIITNF